MSRMKIVLRQTVDNLGEIGDVISVAGGYARNFLIPRGLAVAATKGNVRQADTWKQSKTAKAARDKAHADSLRATLEAARITVQAKAGPDGQLFGSVTAADLAEGITKATGAEVDRRAVDLAAPIRHLGVHQVDVRLASDVVAKITVEVTAAE